MKLRWREATHEEESQYPCVDLGRRYGSAYNFVLEQLDEDNKWHLVEIQSQEDDDDIC